MSSASLVEDPWFEDEDGRVDPIVEIAYAPAPRVVQRHSSTRKQPGASTANAAASVSGAGKVCPGVAGLRGVVHSLRSLCIGCLGLYLEDLAHFPRLDFLPPDVRATFLAIARRRGQVSPALLSLLLDPCWTSMDLAGCQSLKPGALAAALSALPNLRALDLSGCQVTDGVLLALRRSCSSLHVLRLSGPVVNCTTQSTWDSLLDGPAQEATSAEYDDWEALDAEGRSSQSLTALTWLVWPDIPPQLRVMFEQRWPRVRVNPELKRMPAGLMVTRAGALQALVAPEEVSLERPLDAPLESLAGPQSWAGPETARPPAREHIACRFRRVLIEVEESRLRRRAKQLQREQRLVHAQQGQGDRSVEKWLDEL